MSTVLRSLAAMLARVDIGNAIPLRLLNRGLRLANPVRITSTKAGARMEVDLSDFIQSTVFHFGEWEPSISRLIPKLLEPNSRFVDVGANVGYYSLLACSSVEGASAVAIEPSPDIAAKLRRNCDLNKRLDIRIVEKAVGETRGEISLYGAPRDNLGRTSIREDSGFPVVATVQVAPLLSILTKEEAAQTSLIKIDIEGAEVAVIAEIAANLGKFGQDLSIIVECSDIANPRWNATFDALIGKGFSAYSISNPYRWGMQKEARSTAPKPISTLPDHHLDIIFTKKALGQP